MPIGCFIKGDKVRYTDATTIREISVGC